MKYATFGKTGLKVSRIALGGMPFGYDNLARGWRPYTEEGIETIQATIRAALDLGINYFDTAPSYGQEWGHSERMFGRALRGGRSRVHIATKVGCDLNFDATVKGVEESLGRLQTDYVDVIQFHGGRYSPAAIDHILNGGALDALVELRRRGAARFIGFTAEQAWSALPLIETGAFDMCQVCYNIICQRVAEEAINLATEKGMGIAVMRPLASARFHRILEKLEPRWLEVGGDYELCLKFLLSDSRVHVINVGMRWPEEVEKNVRLANGFEPPLDIAGLTGSMLPVYKAEDAEMKDR
jgi:aryl-alcohol dehydrogenase-like predicted oxidoreductase